MSFSQSSGPDGRTVLELSSDSEVGSWITFVLVIMCQHVPYENFIYFKASLCFHLYASIGVINWKNMQYTSLTFSAVAALIQPVNGWLSQRSTRKWAACPLIFLHVVSIPFKVHAKLLTIVILEIRQLLMEYVSIFWAESSESKLATVLTV